MNSLASRQKVPGGMMPLAFLIGTVINAVGPDASTWSGSFTGVLFGGVTIILAAFYVCVGAPVDLKARLHVVKKGGITAPLSWTCG